ncbi:hypothetical protein [Marinobacterium zhoushanense]|uniref:hypothetical protein n=1 Tax=Marinobacterium zhoushanense TaxID=1679163 RepID=UPI001E3A5FE8|nr:hypothetical protein [Marinobacterium zhoushanense]
MKGSDGLSHSSDATPGFTQRWQLSKMDRTPKQLSIFKKAGVNYGMAQMVNIIDR